MRLIYHSQHSKNIYLNFFWAFAYNIVMIPLAAFGYLNPSLAGYWYGIFIDHGGIECFESKTVLNLKRKEGNHEITRRKYDMQSLCHENSKNHY